MSASARATVGGAEYSAATNITIDPKPVSWTGQVSYRANAGELYPGETLYVEVEISQPEGTPWNYIANFTVEADIVDSDQNTVSTVVLGKGLSLTEGMEWSSGTRRFSRCRRALRH